MDNLEIDAWLREREAYPVRRAQWNCLVCNTNLLKKGWISTAFCSQTCLLAYLGELEAPRDDAF